MLRTYARLGFVFLAGGFFAAACSATKKGNEFGAGGSGGSGNGFPVAQAGPGATSAASGIGNVTAAGTGGGGGGMLQGDPTTCDDAAKYKTYVGCDFWPTVVANEVWSIFDYAVVVANASPNPADITIERGGAMVGQGTIQPNGLQKFYLPWVSDLKGPDFDSCTTGVVPFSNSVRSNAGAYHLVSTVPVTVYQFSALEYVPQGGPPGKDWSQCPANLSGCGIPCASFSNDASLLLPSTAMTGNYRVTGQAGWMLGGLGDYFAITATQDNTQVTAYISGNGNVLAGTGIAAMGPNSQLQLTLNAGDVAEVVADPNSDLAGSLVKASAPVQVIAGMPCVFQPFDQSACDHIEETVVPAETLGKHYFVEVPSSPHDTIYGHIVRIYGNADNTNLSYPSGAPPGAPIQINAGQVIDLGTVMQNFEVVGDHEFAVGSFTLAATLVDPTDPTEMQEGDPDESQAVAVEQYRDKYVFLAPNDYEENYVDIVQPMGAQITLDGAPLTATVTPISSGYGVAHVPLQGGAQNGAHLLQGTMPFGIQVMGYGAYTSYRYPGGLNLSHIAAPPPPPK